MAQAQSAPFVIIIRKRGFSRCGLINENHVISFFCVFNVMIDSNMHTFLDILTFSCCVFSLNNSRIQ